jgi:hypothetical protein
MPDAQINAYANREEFPDADALAALRAWYAGLSSREAISRYLPRQAGQGRSARGVLGQIRRALMAAARGAHRDDLASAAGSSSPRAHAARKSGGTRDRPVAACAPARAAGRGLGRTMVSGEGGTRGPCAGYRHAGRPDRARPAPAGNGGAPYPIWERRVQDRSRPSLRRIRRSPNGRGH